MTSEATEIMAYTSKAHLDDEALSRLDFASLVAEMDSGAVPSVDISTLGNGFTVLDNKDLLLGVGFIVADYKFNATAGGSFVTMFVLTSTNQKYIVNDGGTGIYKQMMSFHDKAQGVHARIAVPKGLTKSEYEYVDDKNVRRPACTYYLSLNK